jgi:hypothetical protein
MRRTHRLATCVVAGDDVGRSEEEIGNAGVGRLTKQVRLTESP